MTFIILMCLSLSSLSHDYCSCQGFITCVLESFDDWASSSFGSPRYGKKVSIRNPRAWFGCISHEDGQTMICSCLFIFGLKPPYSCLIFTIRLLRGQRYTPTPTESFLRTPGAKSIAPLDLCIGTQLRCLWLIASSICRSPEWGLRIIFSANIVKRTYWGLLHKHEHNMNKNVLMWFHHAVNL